jgi:LysR family nitrogen assimilation transcriptional regulator
MTMDLRQLRYFVEIVEQGSMKRAAEILYVAQPSLSQHMRNLEDELGVELLARTTRGVTPSEAGLELLAHARSILLLVEEAREAVRSGSAEPRGVVTLGLPNSVSLALGVPLVELTHEKLPKVSLRIIESMSGFILDWLVDGRLDLAMLYDTQRVPGVSLKCLLSEDLYLIMPPQGPLSDKKTVALNELAALDLILPARPHGLRELVERAARVNSIKLNIRTEIDALTQIKALVRRGLGVSVLSHSAVFEELERGELRAARLIDPNLERSVYLAKPTGRPISRAAMATAELLEDCARDLVTSGRWLGRLPEGG